MKLKISTYLVRAGSTVEHEPISPLPPNVSVQLVPYEDRSGNLSDEGVTIYHHPNGDVKEVIHPPKAVVTVIESVPSDDELLELKYRQAQAQGQSHLRPVV